MATQRGNLSLQRSGKSSSGAKSSGSSGGINIGTAYKGAYSGSARSISSHGGIKAPSTINAKDAYINNTANGAVRNAGVDQAAIDKKSYDANDIKTYANRETAYTWVDPKTKKVLQNTYSNLTNYQDAAKALGYNPEDEGKTWKLGSATTYGIAGSAGRGTAYGASGGAYSHSNPASGGWYGETMRSLNHAHNKYGGLETPVGHQEKQYKEYMVQNYIPTYQKDPAEVNWNDVASGKAAEDYHNGQAEQAAVSAAEAYAPVYTPEDAYTAQTPTEKAPAATAGQTAPSPAAELPQYDTTPAAVIPEPEFPAYNSPAAQPETAVGEQPSYLDTLKSYLDILQSGMAFTPADITYRPPDLTEQANNAQSAYKYIPIDAAQWNYDIPETIRLQNGDINPAYTISPASEAYSGMLNSANTDANIAMAQHWAEIAATALNEGDRQYALRQARRYRSMIG